MSPENASWQGGPSPPQVVIQRHHQRQRHNGGATVTWRGPGRSHGEAPCRWDGFTALRNAIFWPIYFKPYSRIKGGKSVVACLTPPSSLDCLLSVPCMLISFSAHALLLMLVCLMLVAGDGAGRYRSMAMALALDGAKEQRRTGSASASGNTGYCPVDL